MGSVAEVRASQKLIEFDALYACQKIDKHAAT
jgi:hypothetical protein